MPLELMREIYESNEDFRVYVDKEYKLRSYDNPEITIDDILQFKIVQDKGWLISDFEKCVAIDACEIGIEAIKKQTEWIPVTERLPKPGEYILDKPKYYLVQDEFGDMMVARYTYSEYWVQIDRIKAIGNDIIAWRELPESYNPPKQNLAFADKSGLKYADQPTLQSAT